MDWLVGLLSNSVFAGGAGVVAMSSVLWLARSAPKVLWMAAQRQLTVTLVIDNSNDLFDRLTLYLSRSPQDGLARWLRMAELYDWSKKRWSWLPTFGLGF